MRLTERDDRERQLEEVRAALADNLALGDVAECASPVAHEVNNFLNSLLLHIAVLEMQLPPEDRKGLEHIRREGKAIAALVQQWQNYRRRPAGGSVMDLNEVVRAVVQHLRSAAAGAVLRPEGDGGGNGAAVRLELNDAPLRVPGTFAELLRLCTFLLRNAAAVTPPGGTIAVRARRSEDTAVLTIEDAGPAVAPEQLGELFTPYPVRREGTNSLELAACKSLVRRLQGTIAAQNRPEGGVAVTVELAVLPEAR
jgi:signal transduction histidine kinase